MIRKSRLYAANTVRLDADTQSLQPSWLLHQKVCKLIDIHREWDASKRLAGCSILMKRYSRPSRLASLPSSVMDNFLASRIPNNWPDDKVFEYRSIYCYPYVRYMDRSVAGKPFR